MLPFRAVQLSPFAWPPGAVGLTPAGLVRSYSAVASAFQGQHMEVDREGTSDVEWLYIIGCPISHRRGTAAADLATSGLPFPPAGRSHVRMMHSTRLHAKPFP